MVFCVGMKIIFWDLKESFIDGLYKGGVVAGARIDQVTKNLDPVGSISFHSKLFANIIRRLKPHHNTSTKIGSSA